MTSLEFWLFFNRAVLRARLSKFIHDLETLLRMAHFTSTEANRNLNFVSVLEKSFCMICFCFKIMHIDAETETSFFDFNDTLILFCFLFSFGLFKTVFTVVHDLAIAIDREGNLWVADCRKGYPLKCFTPQGELREEIYFPVYRVISVAFGGDRRQYMFVTTAPENPSKTDGGQVYWFEAEIAGAEEFVFHL